MKHELYLLEGFLIIAVNVTTIEMNVSSTLFFWHLLWLKQMTTNFIFHSIFDIIALFSLNFSSVGKGPFMDGKAKNIYFSKGSGGGGTVE